jgi:hypothetical protein
MRLHLFEFEDLDWFPQTLRDQITELLQHQLDSRGVYLCIVPVIADLMKNTGANRIIDLGSGSGGDIIRLQREIDAALQRPVEFLLTDKFPNLEAFRRIETETKGRIGHIADSVDATNVPDDLKGVRTLFTAFHHFRPELGRQILDDAIQARSPIFIAEFTERHLPTIIRSIFLGPFIALVDSANIRPFGWRRLLWTYLIPLIPFLYTWDALVSHLRTYSRSELKGLVSDLSASDYAWQIGQVSVQEVGNPRIRASRYITYLIGRPSKPVTAN